MTRPAAFKQDDVRPYSTASLADRWGCSSQKVRQMCEAGLIAAAPELYEALTDMLAMRDAHLAGNVHPKGERVVVEAAVAALAKARGGQ